MTGSIRHDPGKNWSNSRARFSECGNSKWQRGCEMKTILNPTLEMAMPNQLDTDLVQAFTEAFTSDDIESFMSLIVPDCEWMIMATGETFRGLDQIRQLATRSVAARNHTDGLGIKPTNVFTNAEGTKLCWEYVHTGAVTDKWPASSHKPAPGTKFKLPIILVCEITQGKLAKVREYFDLRTLTEAGTSHRLYS
jgi:ketosteroid isomerase-like protein